METAIWVLFVTGILGLLALDLGVLHKRDHVIGFREALMWTALWVALALAFTAVVYFLYDRKIGGFGSEPGLEASGVDAALMYVTGYFVEKSLSVDNIFVIALIISTFRVPRELQHRLLFWGILGALVLRGIMIGAGVALIRRFEWILYVFGGILLLSAAKLALKREEDEEQVRESWTVRLARRLLPVVDRFEGRKFVTRLADGRRAITLMMLALVLIETTDVVFAVDSIPAVFAVTRDPFLVFTSNVFAILGLRSLYFALAGLLHTFHYLKAALIVLLVFIGVKMLLVHHYHIPPAISLAVIASILATAIAASVLHRRGR